MDGPDLYLRYPIARGFMIDYLEVSRKLEDAELGPDGPYILDKLASLSWGLIAALAKLEADVQELQGKRHY